MKALTTAEIRAEIAKLPAEHRATVAKMLFSAYDEGISGGLINMARNLNPFLPVVSPPAAKGKPR